MPREVEFDPFADEAGALPPDAASAPKKSWGEWAKSLVTGHDRTEFPNAPEFKPAYRYTPEVAGEGEPGAGLMAIERSAITPDPAAQLDILKKAIPGLESKTDKFGNLMVKTPGMMSFAYLNKPGASARDLDEIGTQTLATLPLAGMAGLGRSTLAKMGTGLAAGATSSVALDAAATVAGSEQGVDPTRAALTGAIGAGIPAAIGATGAVVGGVGALANRTGDFVRSAMRPAAQAQREVQGAFNADARSGGLAPIGPADRTAAQSRGQDLRVVDFGGETTRALARKSANISPAARDAIMRVITPRSGPQEVGRRGQSLIENEFGLARSSELARQELAQQGRTARQSLYNQAYSQGAGGLDSPVLQQLQTSPLMQRAMARADGMLRDRAATPGWHTTGRVGANGTNFTLEYWDMVKQALDDYAGQAFRQGRNAQGTLIAQMARDLRNDLDAAVPLYRQARGTAATFFDANDALEAGQAFARGGRYNLNDAQRAIQALNPAERNLFREGFADDLVQRIRQNPRYLNQIRDIPAEFDRAQLALGAQNFNELEGFLRLEQIMQRVKDAMGNSTTARQLHEMGQRFGGEFWNMASGSVGGGPGTTTLSPTAIIMGALMGGGKRAHDQVDRQVAEEVAQLLTSADPDVFLQGIRQLGDGRILEAIRAFDHMLTDAGIALPTAVRAGVAQSYQPQAEGAEGR